MSQPSGPFIDFYRTICALERACWSSDSFARRGQLASVYRVPLPLQRAAARHRLLREAGDNKLHFISNAKHTPITLRLTGSLPYVRDRVQSFTLTLEAVGMVASRCAPARPLGNANRRPAHLLRLKLGSSLSHFRFSDASRRSGARI
jgi:hypothetical protein